MQETSTATQDSTKVESSFSAEDSDFVLKSDLAAEELESSTAATDITTAVETTTADAVNFVTETGNIISEPAETFTEHVAKENELEETFTEHAPKENKHEETFTELGQNADVDARNSVSFTERVTKSNTDVVTESVDSFTEQAARETSTKSASDQGEATTISTRGNLGETTDGTADEHIRILQTTETYTTESEASRNTDFIEIETSTLNLRSETSTPDYISLFATATNYPETTSTNPRKLTTAASTKTTEEKLKVVTTKTTEEKLQQKTTTTTEEPISSTTKSEGLPAASTTTSKSELVKAARRQDFKKPVGNILRPIPVRNKPEKSDFGASLEADSLSISHHELEDKETNAPKFNGLSGEHPSPNPLNVFINGKPLSIKGQSPLPSRDNLPPIIQPHMTHLIHHQQQQQPQQHQNHQQQHHQNHQQQHQQQNHQEQQHQNHQQQNHQQPNKQDLFTNQLEHQSGIVGHISNIVNEVHNSNSIDDNLIETPQQPPKKTLFQRRPPPHKICKKVIY